MIKITLARLLNDRNISQADLSRATGIRPSTICDIYNNNCYFIKMAHLDKICSVLNCNIPDIITFIAPPQDGGKNEGIKFI